jgi:cysteine desulfurase
MTRLGQLRDQFEQEVFERVDGSVPNGNRQNRLPNISNISFRSVEGEGLLITLDMQGVAVSTGSACSSGSLEPSPVIRALGRDDELARSAVRVSFGRFNTLQDVSDAIAILPAAIENLRNLAPKNSRTAVK